MTWTQQQVAAYEARNAPKHRLNQDAVERESDLHNQIITHCKNKGWKYVHSRMDKPSMVGEGVADFIIFADQGRVFCIEAKAKGGKLSTEQLIFIAWLKKLQHEVFVVTNYYQFLEIVT